MRTKPYNFIGNVNAEYTEAMEETTETTTTQQTAQPAAEPVKENPAPTEPVTKEPAKPEPGFFEKYKVLIIIIALAAVAFFVWKFKIVSRTAQAVAAVV